VNTDHMPVTTATVGEQARAPSDPRQYVRLRMTARPVNGCPPSGRANSATARRQAYAPVRRGMLLSGAEINTLAIPDEPLSVSEVAACTLTLPPVPPTSAWRTKLAALRGLQPGWNKRGAAAPSELAITNAEALVEAMARRGRVPTRVAASAVGGVGVTRRQGSRMAYAELYNDGSACALFADDDSEGATFPFSTDPDGLHQILDRMEAYLDG
jgi:hypothetical protein